MKIRIIQTSKTSLRKAGVIRHDDKQLIFMMSLVVIFGEKLLFFFVFFYSLYLD